jgi:hypothetical protein
MVDPTSWNGETPHHPPSKTISKPKQSQKEGLIQNLPKAGKKPALPSGFADVIFLRVAHDAVFKMIPIHSKTSAAAIVVCWTHSKELSSKNTAREGIQDGSCLTFLIGCRKKYTQTSFNYSLNHFQNIIVALKNIHWAIKLRPRQYYSNSNIMLSRENQLFSMKIRRSTLYPRPFERSPIL